MYKKEFRHSLLKILNEAGVPQSLSRERFINLSWHMFNNGGSLFHNAIEKDACRFVIGKLKKAHMYCKYRVFMNDTLFKSFIKKKE